MKRGITRRDFVARATAVAGSIALGCTDSSGPDTDPIIEPPIIPGSIDHVIVVTMENRSFDHLLGWLPAADGVQGGLSFPDAAGGSYATHHLTSPNGCGQADPNHSFEGGRAEYNDGACNGWLLAPGNDLSAIGYYEGHDLPFLGKAAPDWLVLDRYFCPIM